MHDNASTNWPLSIETLDLGEDSMISTISISLDPFTDQNVYEEWVDTIINHLVEEDYSFLYTAQRTMNDISSPINTSHKFIYIPNYEGLPTLPYLPKEDLFRVSGEFDSGVYISSNTNDKNALAYLNTLEPSVFNLYNEVVEYHSAKEGIEYCKLSQGCEISVVLQDSVHESTLNKSLDNLIHQGPSATRLEMPSSAGLIDESKSTNLVIIAILIANFMLAFISTIYSRTKEIGILKLYGFNSKQIANELIMPVLIKLISMNILIATVFIAFRAIQSPAYFTIVSKPILVIIGIEILVLFILYLLSVLLITTLNPLLSSKTKRKTNLMLIPNMALRIVLVLIVILPIGVSMKTLSKSKVVQDTLDTHLLDAADLKNVQLLNHYNFSEENIEYLFDNSIFYNSFNNYREFQTEFRESIGSSSTINYETLDYNYVVTNENYIDFVNNHSNLSIPKYGNPNTVLIYYKEKYHSNIKEDYCPTSMICEYISIDDDFVFPTMAVAFTLKGWENSIYIVSDNSSIMNETIVSIYSFIMDEQQLDNLSKQDFYDLDKMNITFLQKWNEIYYSFANTVIQYNSVKLLMATVLVLLFNISSSMLLLLWYGHLYAFRTLFGYSHFEKYIEIYLSIVASNLLALLATLILPVFKEIRFEQLILFTTLLAAELIISYILCKRNDKLKTIKNLKA